MIELTIPGEPYAQKRPRARRMGQHATVYDPAENRNWKATAQQYMKDAMGERPPLVGPVRLVVLAGFTMPKGRWFKKAGRLRASEPHTKRPDLDNVVKAVKDAATGILWLDDSQVCELTARKRTMGQGEAPSLFVMAQEL